MTDSPCELGATGRQRAAYEQAHGPIPDGHHVHHTCEQPRCGNPKHLVALTPSEHGREHARLRRERPKVSVRRYAPDSPHFRVLVALARYRASLGVLRETLRLQKIDAGTLAAVHDAEVLSVPELAEVVGLSRARVYQLIEQGRR